MSKILLLILILLSCIMTNGDCSIDEPVNTITGSSLSQQSDTFAEKLQIYRSFVNNGDLVDASNMLKEVIELLPPGERQDTFKEELYTLNMKILFSRTMTPNAVLYEVRSGDTLGKIARKHKTTIELIMKSNGLLNHIIRPREKLKIFTGKFHLVIDKSANKLTLLADDEVLKVYTVATGKNNSTPVGTYKIESKLEDPTWFNAGAIVPPDSPENILGTRWLGISYPGYGIHGTTKPESIGSQSTSGCIRMINSEVEELYSIVPYGTEVEIKD